MRTLALWGTRLAVLLTLGALGGCTAVTPLTGPASQPTAVEPHGEVRVSVHWPVRIQTIPLSAETLELTLSQAGVTTATASIDRPATSTSFAQVPIGTYLLSAVARRADAGRTVAAEATASVSVLPSSIAQAKLSLVPTHMPQLDYLYPAAGPANRPISLYGANLLPPQGGTVTVLVDNQPAPTGTVQANERYVLLTELPSWAGATCSLALSVDGMTTAARTFTRLDHLALLPASASMAPGATLKLTAIAYADAAESATVSVPLIWSLEDALPDPGNFELQPDNTLASGPATGSVTVRIALGNLVATASVTVD